MKYKTWIYNGRGVRNLIYDGTGGSMAVKIAAAVGAAVAFVKGSCRVQVMQAENGALTEGKPFFTRDIINGEYVQAAPDALFRLSLDQDAEVTEAAWRQFDKQRGITR